MFLSTWSKQIDLTSCSFDGLPLKFMALKNYLDSRVFEAITV
jgi:hypothetical protein